MALLRPQLVFDAASTQSFLSVPAYSPGKQAGLTAHMAHELENRWAFHTCFQCGHLVKMAPNPPGFPKLVISEMSPTGCSLSPDLV